MYYEEEVINGILCHRDTPQGKWIPFSSEELTRQLMVSQSVISQLVLEVYESRNLIY